MSVDFFPTRPGTDRRRFARRIYEQPCRNCAQRSCQPGWCDNGVEIVEEPTTPELNLANANARALLGLLGLLDDDPELYGDRAPNAVDPALAAVRRLLAAGDLAQRRRADALRAGGSDSGAHGARVHFAALDDDGIVDRLRRLEAVLVWAQAHGAGFAWE